MMMSPDSQRARRERAAGRRTIGGRGCRRPGRQGRCSRGGGMRANSGAANSNLSCRRNGAAVGASNRAVVNRAGRVNNRQSGRPRIANYDDTTILVSIGDRGRSRRLLLTAAGAVFAFALAGSGLFVAHAYNCIVSIRTSTLWLNPDRQERKRISAFASKFLFNYSKSARPDAAACDSGFGNSGRLSFSFSSR